MGQVVDLAKEREVRRPEEGWDEDPTPLAIVLPFVAKEGKP